jgi:hypothetical protein
MKKAITNFAFGIVLLLAGANMCFAQTDKPYTDGPVWNVQFVHSKPGMTMLYYKNLSEGWVKQMKAAKEAGYITDYKVLSAMASSENDWDLVLMYQVKNYAALDGMVDRMNTLSKKVFNADDDGLHTKAVARNDLRTLMGGKITQELVFK